MSNDQAELLGATVDNLLRYEKQLTPTAGFSPFPQLTFDFLFLQSRSLRGHTVGKLVMAYIICCRNLSMASLGYLVMLGEVRGNADLLDRLHFDEPDYSEALASSGTEDLPLPPRLHLAFEELPNDLQYALGAADVIEPYINDFEPFVTSSMLNGLRDSILEHLEMARAYEAQK